MNLCRRLGNGSFRHPWSLGRSTGACAPPARPSAAPSSISGKAKPCSRSPPSGSSPCAEREVESRPIKGTRPRGANPREDRALCRELLESEKDRAELSDDRGRGLAMTRSGLRDPQRSR